MSGVAAQKRFAPPPAEVEDHEDIQVAMMEASRAVRLVAFLVDAFVPAIVLIGIGVSVALPAYRSYRQAHIPGIEPPALGSANHMTSAWVFIGALTLAAFLIWSIVLVYRYGQTVGKRMMGIRVVRTDGSRVSLPRFLFMRGLPVAILGVLPLLRYVMFLVDSLVIFRESRQCLHDNFADTKVVTAASSEAATLAGDSGANLRTISF